MPSLPNIHPGEILLEEFLKPLHITAYALSKSIQVSQIRISEIIHGKRSVTADTALRLAVFFGITPEFWMNLQSIYDLEELKKKKDIGALNIPSFRSLQNLDRVLLK